MGAVEALQQGATPYPRHILQLRSVCRAWQRHSNRFQAETRTGEYGGADRRHVPQSGAKGVCPCRVGVREHSYDTLFHCPLQVVAGLDPAMMGPAMTVEGTL